MITYIWWKEACVAGNPRINRDPDDNYLVWISGMTRMNSDRDTAVDTFRNCFPRAVITRVE